MGTQQEFVPSNALSLKGCMEAKAGVIMPGSHRNAIWMLYALYENGVIITIIVQELTRKEDFTDNNKV